MEKKIQSQPRSKGKHSVSPEVKVCDRHNPLCFLIRREYHESCWEIKSNLKVDEINGDVSQDESCSVNEKEVEVAL